MKKKPNRNHGFPVDQKPGGPASPATEKHIGKRIGSNTDQQRPRKNFHYHRSEQDQVRKESSEEGDGTSPAGKGGKSLQSHHLSQSEYRQGFESAVDAIVGIDTKGRIIFLNKGAEELFQYSTAELLGRSVEILIPVRFRQTLVEQRRKTSANPWGYFTKAGKDLYARRKNATEFQADTTVVFLQTEKEPLILTTIRDLSKHKQREDQLLQAQKMEALGCLAGGVAHDFNNLLSVILGYTELELKNPTSNTSPIRKSLKEIQKAGTAAASLTHQLLLFGRKEVQDPKIVNLNEVLNEMAGMVSQLLNDDIELVMKMDPNLGTVKIDPTQMKQVILNLAANARDAMPHGGKLMIETANVDFDGRNVSLSNVPPGRYVKLKVEDTGRGIDEYVRSHIFEPFVTTKKEGTGLGLATVYGIIKQSGGDIVVDSAPRQGTTFAIFIPRLRAAHRIRHIPTLERNPVGGSATILIVEDRDSLRELVCKYLKGCGYKVLEAKDGIRALRKVKRYHGPIHLLLTDVVMPVISGPELSARVKARFPETKVMFMSGCSLDTTQRHGLPNEGILLLRKPFQLGVLAQNVYEALNGGNRSED